MWGSEDDHDSVDGRAGSGTRRASGRRKVVGVTGRARRDTYCAGRLAGGLAPGGEICVTCDAGISDLEPMGDTDPAPEDA